MSLETGVPPGLGRVRGWLAAAAVLSCLFVAFFWPALARYPEVYYSPADVSQVHSLTEVQPGHVPGNELLSDLAVQMEPWLMFNRSELGSGRLPLWNPWNGGGAPHLGNGQAAVFSPFSLPYYLLSFRAALIVSAALKLAVLGLFTFVFLRRVGLFVLPSLVGATAFAFAGHNVLLLGYPHPAAAAALPAGLYFVERTFQRFDAVGRHAPGSLIGLCLSLAVGLVSGQPEPGFFAIVLVALYAIVRAVNSWRKRGGTLRAALDLSPRLLQVAVAACLAAGLCAFKVLPFLEYLQNSRLLEQRSHVQTPLIGVIWPLQLFPNLLGNPSTDYYLHPSLPPPNFETANLVYIGGLVLFLALASLAFVRRSLTHAFFAVVAGLWILYAYDVGGAWHIFAWIPGLDLAPINRSQPIWLFAVACCAAFAVQRMVVADRRRVVVAVSALAIGAALLFFARAGADGLLASAVARLGVLSDAPKLELSEIHRFASEHVLEMSIFLALGAVAFAAGWLAPRGPVRHSLAAGIVVMVYLGSGNLFKQYNPVCENRFFFPVTPAIEALKKNIGEDRLVILGENTLVPDTNMVYGISLVASYDGLWVGRYDRLYRELFGESNNWRHSMRGTGKALKLFGAEWVLSPDEWIPISTEFASSPPGHGKLYPAGEILPNVPMRQGFTVTRNRLQAIRLFATAAGGPLLGLLYWDLSDARTDESLANGTAECSQIRAAGDQPQSVILRLDSPLNLIGRALRLRIRAPAGASPGHAVSLWARRDGMPIVNAALWHDANARAMRSGARIDASDPCEELKWWRGSRAGQLIEGGLCIDLSYALNDFERIESIPPFDLFRYTRGRGPWYVVSKSLSVRSEEDAWQRTLHPAIDPALTVVLERDEPDPANVAQAADEETKIEVEQDFPSSKRLRFTRKGAGWLVLTQPWYPGWRARVNGVDQPIVRANYAFGAVKVEAGESLVELDYAPRSFAFGAWISLASLVVGAFLVAVLGYTDRAFARVPAPLHPVVPGPQPIGLASTRPAAR
ncbi:MAG TPA: YfhO family protein [Planctomycetota bacterium]|nr:YfhO family protein [Planctomycetota bacterium]